MILLKGIFFLFLIGIVFVVVAVLSVAFKIYRMHQQLKNNAPQDWQYDQPTQKNDGSTTVSDRRDPAKANRKIFSDDEGEYIDYEEEK